MKYLIVSCAIFVAFLGYSGASYADEPSFRRCELGFVHRDVETSARFSQVSPLDGAHDGAFELDPGFAIDCEFGIDVRDNLTVFAFGGFERVDAQAEIDSTFATGCGLFASPGTACTTVITTVQESLSGSYTTFKGGVGVAADIALGVAAYAKAGVNSPNLSDIESVLVADGTDLKPLAEIGARWRALPIVELGGFVRYDGAGDIGTQVGARAYAPANGAPVTVLEVVAEEDIRAGVDAAFNVFGPAWVAVGYEIGSSDRLFAGLRAAF